MSGQLIEALAWVASDAPASKRAVKGAVLARAYVPRTNYRFLIEEVRHGDGGAAYRLRDAHTVSDADVREGIHSKVVYRSRDLSDVLDHVRQCVS